MHKLLEEKEKIMCKVCDIQEKLACALESQMDNLESLNAEEAGEVMDMVKDCSETVYYITKAAYYKQIMEAMEEEEKSMRYNESRMGYNNRRYADGRYAPAGRGRVYGYDREEEDFMFEREEMWPGGRGRSGYSVQSGSSNSGNYQGGSGNRSGFGNDYGMVSRQKYGNPYMNYQDARRFYTESHSEQDKKKMEEHAKEHLHDTIDTMKDIWKDADQNLKQKMKQDLTNLINEMNG